MVKVAQPPDPWQAVVTANGFAADEVISALQKSIRRGLAENAVLLGWEMYLSSDALEEVLWSRLGVISVEDVGMGNRDAPMAVESLYQMHLRHERPAHDRFLFAAHAIRLLAASPKDRTTDDMVNWAKHSMAFGERRPEILDVALDMHTRRGQQMGRDYRFFVEQASRVVPESAEADRRYRDWLLAALDAGKLS